MAAQATREQGRSFPGRRFDGPRFRELRELAGLSQSEAARRAGIGQPLLSLYEHGRYTPRPEYLLLLAGVVGVEDPRELLKPAA